MDLNAASIFVRVASTLNFAAAARALGVPRSTVSRKVAELEEDLGVQLLERTPRRVRLTEAGRRLEASLSKAMTGIEEAWQEVNGYAQAATGDLRVAVPALFARLHLAGLAAAFARAHPDVRLVVDVRDDAPGLGEEHLDARLSHGAPDERGAEGVRLCGAVPLLVASPAYLARHPAPRHPAELAAHACLGQTGTTARVTWTFQQGGRTFGQAVRPALAAADPQVLAALAEEGLGVAQLPAFLAAPGLAAGTLVELLPELRPPPVELYLVHRAGAQRPALRAFLDVLREHLAARGGGAGEACG